jgi:DNA (cytosine-5)-methyltransferase 1
MNVPLRELHLFAGAGGGILGGKLLGNRIVCAVEIEEYPRKVLLQRQIDGVLPWFPIWDDITTFDGRPWKGIVDVVAGGFPCQDISIAGKGAGIGGERSGLWSEMARVIGEIQPRIVIVENSPALTSRGLGDVLRDLAEMGFNARWCVLGADDAGAPHRRKRIWILAYASEKRLQGSEQYRPRDEERNRTDAHGSATERRCLWWGIDPADLPDTMYSGLSPEGSKQQPTGVPRADIQQRSWTTQSGLGGMAHELANRMDLVEAAFGGKVPRVEKSIENRVNRLKAIGNGQVPATMALAWEVLTEGLFDE